MAPLRFRRSPARVSDDCNCTAPTPDRGATDRDGDRPIVVLVHGTFSPHADWVQRESALHQSITKAGADVRTWCWSGKNSHQARLDAARELRHFLLAIRRQHPGASCHVIAHSHGGNVALYALDTNGSPADREALSTVMVTTLATPFFSLEPRPLPLDFRQKTRAAEFLSLIGAITSAFVAVVLVVGALAGRQSSLSPWLAAALVPAAAFLAFVAVGPRLTRRRFEPPGANEEDRLIEEMLTPALSDDDWLADLLTPPLPNDDRLLVVRSPGDEASGVLNTLSLARWITDKAVAFLMIVERVLSGALLVGAVLGVIILAIAGRDIDSIYGWLTGVAVVTAVGVIAAAIVLLGLVYALSLLFGRDGLFFATRIAVTAEAAPRGHCPIVHVPSCEGASLAHGVYDNEHAIAVVRNRVQSDLVLRIG